MASLEDCLVRDGSRSSLLRPRSSSSKRGRRVEGAGRSRTELGGETLAEKRHLK